MNYNDYTLLSVTFNNNVLTGMMIKSFQKQMTYLPNVVIVDNGNVTPADPLMKRVFCVVDNFNHALLPDERQPSRNHCAAIDYALNNVVRTKWCVLADNDILYKPQVRQLIESVTDDYDVYGEIGWDCTPPNRLFPYFCIINVEKMRQEKIKYFDRERIIQFHTVGDDGNILYTDPQYNIMDTGYSFYEDVKNSWRIKQILLNDVCIHLKSGMLAGKNVEQWLIAHRDLF